MGRSTCQVVDVDGTPVRVHGDGKPLSAEDREALRLLVAAAQQRLAAEPLEAQLVRQQRQEEGRERLRRLRERLNG